MPTWARLLDNPDAIMRNLDWRERIVPTLMVAGVVSLLLSQLSNAQRNDQSASPAADLTASSPGPWDNHSPCSTNKECIAAHGGEPYICQKVTRTCVRLTSSECTLLAEESDISDDNTVWVGLVTNVTDRPLRPLSVDFARREFVKVGNGLPPANPGAAHRPLAFVSCDSTKGIDPIFNHLISELNLSAIIGPVYSQDTLRALTKYTLPAKAVMMSTATAAVFTGMQSGGLFLRTLASDALQGKVLAFLPDQYVEPELRSDGVLAPGEQMKLFVAYRDDVYGQAIAHTLRTELRFNGKTAAANGDRFQIADFGDPGDLANTLPDAKYASTAAKILAMRPHVIAIVGSLETEKIIRAVEEGWPATLSYRPRWIGSEAVAVVLARLGTLEASFARRFLFTNVRINFESPVARSLISSVAEEHPDVVKRDARSVNALGLYDSVYAMAYAIASLRDEPLTGPNIAAALRRLNQPGAPVVNVGGIAIPGIYERLKSGRPFDLQGASGSLDWDQNGDVVQDIDILCVKTATTSTGASASIGTKPSGLYYDVRQNRFVGKIANCPGP